MKKIVLLAMALVLAFSSLALAADVKVGGEVRYNLALPSQGDPAGSGEYRLKVNATIDDNTNGFLFWRAKNSAVAPTDLFYAEINTKLAGGTARFGKVEFGSSPWAIYGGIASSQDGSYGISYASADMNGLAFQGFVAPNAGKWDLAGEATYKLLGGSVGVAVDKAGANDKAGFSVFGSYPVVADVLTVNAEVGKTYDENDVQIVGVSGAVSGVSYLAESDLKAKKTYVQGSYTVNSVVYTLSYQTGDGYTGGDKGKVNLQAKIKF
ncbi:MAG TPA: hypothetical protein GXX28_10405 [Firmicutes bacterium]|nr:hypothetical protein [Bacillota bacterium]